MLISILTSSVVSAIVVGFFKWYEMRSNFNNSKYMQIASYYREISGKDMQEILEKWTDILMDFKNADLDDVNKITKLIKTTYLYSSPVTCKRLADFQAYNFKGNTETTKSLVLAAGIIVSLKNDFTGEWVTIEETLKLILTDFEEHEAGFKEVISQLKY